MPYLPISAEFENRVTTKHGVMVRYFPARRAFRCEKIQFIEAAINGVDFLAEI